MKSYSFSPKIALLCICAIVLIGFTACTSGPPKTLIEAASINQIDSMATFIEDGTDINQPDKGGNTPLMMAVYYNQHDAVEYLLSKGANVDAQNQDGQTALMYAVWNMNSRMIKTLLKHDPDVTIVDKSGHTALEYAKQKNLKGIADSLEKRTTP